MEQRKSSDPATLHGFMPLLKVTYITDPLCCWSFGMQPHLDKLQDLYGEHISVQYLMGGMLPDWDKFHDEVNMVKRPAQMGPVWMHAAQLTGRPIYHQLWVMNPPSSSYPACIAVKCASLQSSQLGIDLFRGLQQAAMTDGKNIASWKVIHAVAEDLTNKEPLFNLEKFTADYQDGHGASAFRQDLEVVANQRITRFPTIMMEVEGQRGILLKGFRSYDVMRQAIEQAFPGLENNFAVDT